MSRQNPDRSIPHLRDIFGFHGAWENHSQNNVENVQHQFQDMRLSKGDSSHKTAGNDSAVSVGSTSEEEIPKSATKEKKKKQRNSRRDNSRTLTERDVKHLERHLSMKKTIRKKIMRDLQQAFVEDPNEFRVEDIPPEKLKAEINVESLSFGPPSNKAGKKMSPEANFLDMLRGGSGGGGGGGNTPATPSGRFMNDDDDSGHGSPTRDSGGRLADCDDDDDIYEAESANKKTSFWRRFTMKGRNKR